MFRDITVVENTNTKLAFKALIYLINNQLYEIDICAVVISYQ